MRLLVKARNENEFHALRTKLNSSSCELKKVIKSKKMFVIQVGTQNSQFLVELLERNAIIERDIQNDLD